MDVLYSVLESSEGSIPKSLESVIRHIQKTFENPTTNQLLMGVMYTLMLECGYTLVFPEYYNFEKLNISQENNTKNDIDNMPALDKKIDPSLLNSSAFNFKQVLSKTNLLMLDTVEENGVFKLTFHLISLPEFTFTLVMICRRGLAIVNLVENGNEKISECYSFVFSPSSYVQESNDDGCIASKFYDLKSFCILFKDNIAMKGRSHVLNSLLIANNSLEGLPEELFLKIIRLLQIDDILNVAVTCTKFFSGVRQCSLWKFLLKRDFSLTIHYDSVEQLIFAYREEKIRRNSISRNRIVDIDEMFEDADIPCNRTQIDIDPEDLPVIIMRKLKSRMQ